MASMIPLLLQFAPEVISKLPKIVGDIGHVIGKTVEGIQDVTQQRTVNGIKEIPKVEEQKLEDQAFKQSKMGISDRTFINMNRSRAPRRKQNSRLLR
jgi:hypothetical protein